MTDNYLHQSTDQIKYLKVFMYRPNMDSLPIYPLPSGYSIQLYKDGVNDKQKWVEIAMAAGEFRSMEQGFDMFDKCLAPIEHKKPLSQCIHFLVNSDGKYIGTASAGIHGIDGQEHGRLDWVSIIPEYQGKKLAKPMISVVLQKIAEYANECYLESQTTSWRAINMYTDFGFIPHIQKDDCREAWQLLSKLCQRKFIEEND